MKTLPVSLALALSACGSFHYRASMPRPPVCVVGDIAPIEDSMDDYGSTYTRGLNGPAPAAVDSHLVPEWEVGENCVAPPWWTPE